MATTHEKDQAQNATSTMQLLARARSGERTALELLYARYLPRLQRWAQARLPRGARGALETNDVVQDALLQTLHRLDDFDPKHSGAFRGYLRQALRHRIIDEARRVQRRPESEPASSGIVDPGPSPLDEVIGRECLERYERAFARLTPVDQAALTLRLEDKASYEEIAEELRKPSADAARMAVKRALVRLTSEMVKDRE